MVSMASSYPYSSTAVVAYLLDSRSPGCPEGSAKEMSFSLMILPNRYTAFYVLCSWRYIPRTLVMISYIMAKLEYSESKLQMNKTLGMLLPTMLSRQQTASTPNHGASGRNPMERIVSGEIAG